MSAQAAMQTIAKPTTTPDVHGLLQRCTATTECEDCRRKREGTLQRAAVNSSPVSEVPPIVHEVLRSPGQPLDAQTRAFMEPRFGHDFSSVRVHTDTKAAASARAVNALAYTVGRDIVFDTGQYVPKSSLGQRVMVHELTHVMQQNFASPDQNLVVGPTNDIFESQAGEAVQSMNHIPTTQVVINAKSTAGARLQRLGANPGCTDAQAGDIHQAIFNARSWVNKAIARLEASPLASQTLASLQRNFGPTYGVAVNASLIAGRLRSAYREMSTIPFTCAGAADATCAAGHCGYATAAGSHAAVICTNSTLATPDPVFRAGCVLHESLHASFTRFTVDEYSGWHGHSSSTATFPGAGTDPLLNADSYTTLAMDLSGR